MSKRTQPSSGIGEPDTLAMAAQDSGTAVEETVEPEAADTSELDSAAEQTSDEQSDTNTGVEKPRKKTRESKPPITQKPPHGKQRIRHPRLKGKNLIVGSAVVAFDQEGCAELDAEQAAYLLTIPGYEKG